MNCIDLLEEYVISIEYNDNDNDILVNFKKSFYEIKELKTLNPNNLDSPLIFKLAELGVFPPIINTLINPVIIENHRNKVFFELIINFLKVQQKMLKNSEKNTMFFIPNKTISNKNIDLFLLLYISSWVDLIPLPDIIKSLEKEPFISKTDKIKLEDFSAICINDSLIIDAILETNILTPYLQIIKDGLNESYSLKEIFVYLFNETI